MSVHLILGGARSGKSGFAESAALQYGGNMHFSATAVDGDAEMAKRIAHHQQHRDPHFATHECPLELAAKLTELNQPGNTILVDCLTLWLTNVLDQPEQVWQQQRKSLLAQLRQMSAQCLLVSNEVGQGIVPLGELTRRFVDEAGRLHQDIAENAEQVTLVVAGLPLTLK